MTEAKLIPRTDRPSGHYRVDVTRSTNLDLSADSDVAVVEAGQVAVSVLSRLTHRPVELAPLGDRLNDLLGSDHSPG
jgi:hypothetical protein